MSKQPSLLIDLLGIGRVANLPSVITNLCVGLVIALPFSAHSENQAYLFNYKIFLSGICLYLAGCFLNDWADARWDSEHKPTRPIPSQRVKKTPLLLVSIILLIIPHLLCWPAGTYVQICIGLITTSILIYTAIHKRTPLAVIPMGLCRALLYPLGFCYALGLPSEFKVEEGSVYYMMRSILAGSEGTDLLISPQLLIGVTNILPLMIGLLCYIAGLSLLARSESKNIVPRVNRVAAYCLIFLIPLTHIFMATLAKPIAVLIGLPLIIALIMAVKKIRHSVSAGVSLLLASICLADLTFQVAYYYIFPNEGFGHSPVPLIITAVCFPLALLLQKIAPAT